MKNHQLISMFLQRYKVKILELNFKQAIEKGIKNLDYNALKVQLRKIAQLILETLQIDLK